VPDVPAANWSSSAWGGGFCEQVQLKRQLLDRFTGLPGLPLSFHQDSLDLQLIDSKQLRQALQVALGSHVWRGSDSSFRKTCLIYTCFMLNFGVKALALEFYGANYGLKVGFLCRNDTTFWRSRFVVGFFWKLQKNSGWRFGGTERTLFERNRISDFQTWKPGFQTCLVSILKSIV